MLVIGCCRWPFLLQSPIVWSDGGDGAEAQASWLEQDDGCRRGWSCDASPPTVKDIALL